MTNDSQHQGELMDLTDAVGLLRKQILEISNNTTDDEGSASCDLLKDEAMALCQTLLSEIRDADDLYTCLMIASIRVDLFAAEERQMEQWMSR